MATNEKVLEIPLQTGTSGAESNRKVGFAEVKMFLAQVETSTGEEDYLMAVIGNELRIIEVKSRKPAEWLKKVFFDRLAKRNNGGVEQT